MLPTRKLNFYPLLSDLLWIKKVRDFSRTHLKSRLSWVNLSRFKGRKFGFSTFEQALSTCFFDSGVTRAWTTPPKGNRGVGHGLTGSGNSLSCLAFKSPIETASNYLKNVTTIAMVVAVCACSQLPHEQVPDLRVLPSVSEYHPKAPRTWQLDNGLTVLFSPDRELPLVQGALFIKGGGLWEADGEVGSTTAMGDQLRNGGAGMLSPLELDVELDRLAASIDSNFSGEVGKVAFGCLESDFSRVFDLFADIVLRPKFDEDRLDLWKGQTLDGIKRRVEDGDLVAQIGFTQLLYGIHPLGRITTDGDIKRITRSSLVRAYNSLVKPDQAVLAISGSIEENALRAAINQKFGGWKPRNQSLPLLPLISSSHKPGIYFIELPFSQSSILMGQLGVPRLTPDYPAIDSFNDIFGSSGFGSRLMNRIRTELGLAYGIYGMISPGVIQGKNFIGLQTKSESTALAISESLLALKRLQTEEVGTDELEEAKRAIGNSFIFKFDSTEKSLQRNAYFHILSYPEDYDTTYISKIQSVNASDILKVAQTRWDINKFVIVVVGDKTAYTSLTEAVKLPNSNLYGIELRKLRFDQKLMLP